jgi:hypothetical protein
MQGYDYGYSDVPSISRRDAAITYRDYVLYEDFGLNDFWFPIANLMTHGIIKGYLQNLGGESEPLDKFTDNAVLYFARGVSMWELYISPSLLTDGEWNALVQSIHWAMDRFDILKETVMIGGNPGDRESYGYVHFSGNRGIIALRNPFIDPCSIKVELDPSYGICQDASSLVLERSYPTRWISPDLYNAGAKIIIPLNGYETAIYEVNPLSDAHVPLLADVVYEVVQQKDLNFNIEVYETGDNICFLNSDGIEEIRVDDQLSSIHALTFWEQPLINLVENTSIFWNGSRLNIGLYVDSCMNDAMVAVLFDPFDEYKEDEKPDIQVRLNNKKIQPLVEEQKGGWMWVKIQISPGNQDVQIRLKNSGDQWRGTVSAWVIGSVSPKSSTVKIKLSDIRQPLRPVPPSPYDKGTIRKQVKIGALEIR